MSARTFFETEKIVVCGKIVFGIVTGRIEHNVLRICPVRLSKLPVSIPTNVYIEDNCFLASHKKGLRSRQFVRARAVTESAALGEFAVSCLPAAHSFSVGVRRYFVYLILSN
ncbi:MAG: hypothetical protein JNJ40_19645 [Bacteroidia bacterium]|nr:hypothetical protein [Bacteroidia bacterium]